MQWECRLNTIGNFYDAYKVNTRQKSAVQTKPTHTYNVLKSTNEVLVSPVTSSVTDETSMWQMCWVPPPKGQISHSPQLCVP